MVGSTIGLCDSQAKLILGTVKIKDQFQVPLDDIDESYNKHRVKDVPELRMNFQDGFAWVWELENAQVLEPAVPYNHLKGHQTWVKLVKPDGEEKVPKKRRRLGSAEVPGV